MQSALFTPVELRHITLPNRIVRSATYEGWGDPNGAPRPELGNLYAALARGGAGTIVTGFSFISREGRAMQPGQCGIDADDKIEPWSRIVRKTREAEPSVKAVLQLAHAGRQTRRGATGLPAVGASRRRCSYFRQRVRPLDNAAILRIVGEFAEAARRAAAAGFDAIQLHAAHGYLIHQFLSPWTNTRRDRWADPPLFLEEVIGAVRSKCGERFPILVKLSAEEDNAPGLGIEDTIRTVKRLKTLGVDAVEVSCGTMEWALNIIRGACPVSVVLKVNPLFRRVPPPLRVLWRRYLAPRYLKRIKPFSENYNVPAAERIQRETRLPLIPVGGIRSLESADSCVSDRGFAAVALCRPLICEPDLPTRFRDGISERSACIACNLCTVYCDSDRPVQCYTRRKKP